MSHEQLVSRLGIAVINRFEKMGHVTHGVLLAVFVFSLDGALAGFKD
jgi:hypothetical protein